PMRFDRAFLLLLLLHAAAAGDLELFLVRARLVQRLIDAEARRLLTRRELLEGLEELSDERLRRDKQEHAVSGPLTVEQGSVFVASLERIAAQVVDFREAQRNERLLPDGHPMGALLQERGLPLRIPQRHQVAVVA